MRQIHKLCRRLFLRELAGVPASLSGTSRTIACVVASAFALLITGVGSPLQAQAADVPPETMIVWSEPDGADFDVWFSYVVDEKWTTPERIDRTPDFLDALPCVAGIEQGHVAVWTRFTEPGVNQLSYSVRDAKGWQVPRHFKTGMTINMAVTLVRDRDGTLWLGWAGFDGSDDDIYVSRWQGDEWSARRRVNRNDFTPDVLPQLSLDTDGRAVVRWRSLEPAGYVQRESRFDGRDWSVESAVRPVDDSQKTVRDRRLESIPEIPEFVSDPGKSCMTVMDTFPIQTIRLPKPVLTPESGQ